MAPLRVEFGCPHLDILIPVGADHTASLTLDTDAIHDCPDWLDRITKGLQRLSEAVSSGAVSVPTQWERS